MIITVLGAVAGLIFEVFAMAELMEFRIKEKEAYIASAVFSVFYIVLVLFIYLRFGSTIGGQLYLFYGAVPLIIFFYLISYYRDGRLFFSFFAIQIILTSVITLTNLVDSFFPTKAHLVHSLSRLVLFPLIFVVIRKYISAAFHKIQAQIQTGWNLLAIISGLFCVMLLYSYNYPELLFERPYDIPTYLMLNTIVFLFMYQTVTTLNALQQKHEMERRDALFLHQTAAIQSRIEQTELAQKQLAIQRHDLRHRYNTILSLLDKGEVSEACAYIRDSASQLNDISHAQYCGNLIINATLEVYAALAEYHNITLETKLDVPEHLPVNDNEFSVVIANALENAINAVKDIEEDRRVIKLKCISSPGLMLQIKNPAGDNIHFDKNGIPVSNKKGQGIGTLSIEQYCIKNNAMCEYFIEDGYFVFRLGHMEKV